MSDELYPDVETVQDAPPLFQPSAALRRRLFWGALATVLGGSLGLGAIASPDPDIELALNLGAVVPVLIMLWTYLLLARDVGSMGLRRTSLGMLGMVVLFSFLPLLEPERWQDDWAPVVVAAVLGIMLIALLWAVAYRPAWARPSEPGSTTETQKKAGWGGGLGFVIFVKLILLRKLAPRLGVGVDMGELAIMVLLGVALIFILFTFIGGIVKLRLTGRLGVTSGLLGLTELLSSLILTGLLGAFLYAMYMAIENAGPKREDMELAVDKLIAAWEPTMQAVGLGVHAAWTFMTLLFFWTVRGSADPEEVLGAEL